MAVTEITDFLKHILRIDSNKKPIHRRKSLKVENAEEWKKRIKPLIKEVNITCKKKSFTTLRAWQLKIIIFITLIIAMITVAENYIASYLVNTYADIIPSIAPSNHTQVILNQTVTDSQLNQLNYIMQQFPTLTALTVAAIAIIVTLFSIMIPLMFGKSSYEDLSNEYYKQLSKNKPERIRPYLKALINMKCMEFDLDLENVYDLNPELFTQESLLKSLYNSRLRDSD